MDQKTCINCKHTITIQNQLRCISPLNTNAVNINRLSNRACNQDWEMTPVYVSFEVDNDDRCEDWLAKK